MSWTSTPTDRLRSANATALTVSAEARELLELAARSVDGDLERGFDAHAAGPG